MNIKNYRNAKNWSQSELAEKIEVSVNTISLIERGKTFVSIPRLFELCEKLEISLFDLFKDTSIVKTKAPRNFSEQYNQLNDTNKAIVSGILNVFIKNQRVSEKSENFNQNNMKTYYLDNNEENIEEEKKSYLNKYLPHGREF